MIGRNVPPFQALVVAREHDSRAAFIRMLQDIVAARNMVHGEAGMFERP